MSYVNVMPSLHVADFETVVQWYTRLFGREPDRRPMDGDVEWQLAESGGLQLFHNREHPVTATVILGVDDIEAQLAEIATRGIEAQPFDVTHFRLAQVEDPAGNVLVLSQPLT